MAYEKQTWQSNELITTEKLNHMEDGIAAAVNPDIVDNLTETTTGKVLDATQGKVLKDTIDNLNADDVDAIAKDIPYTFTSNYTGNEVIPLYNATTDENYSTSINALLSQAGGGSSSQGALVNYKKTVSLSAGSSSQSFNDTNITGDMVVLEATIDNPAAQGSDWNVTTADGTVTITGTVSAATNVTLYFGVGVTTAPSILTNLGSTSADNILKTAPRPGVMGVLGVPNGGTGASNGDAACANIGAVKKSGDTMTGTLAVTNWLDINNQQTYRYGIINFIDTVGNMSEAIDIIGYGEEHILGFRQKNAAGDGYEEYQLPPPIAASGQAIGYSILTTRSPVLVTQGGTGATTPAQARANLEITPANIGAPSTTGSGASGTWGIDITGHASSDLPLTGGVLTGALALLNNLSINDQSQYRYGVIHFMDTVRGLDGGACEIVGYTDNHYFEFREKNSSGRAYEAYSLPVPTVADDQPNGCAEYSILTSKNTVTIPQGGTNATTPEGARTNLGAMGSQATVATFGGSANYLYSDMSRIVGSMSDYEARIFVFYVDQTDGIFHIYHTFTGVFTLINNDNGATGSGIFSDQTGKTIVLFANGGNWGAKLIVE